MVANRNTDGIDANKHRLDDIMPPESPANNYDDIPAAVPPPEPPVPWHLIAVDSTFTTYNEELEDESYFFYINNEMWESSKEQSNSLCGYPRRQTGIFVNFLLVNFCSAACISLQGPLYPSEANKKHLSPSEFGFVFGIYQLVMFIMSLFYGKFIQQIGLKFLLVCGILVASTTCIMFGCLDFVTNSQPFLILSLLIRAIEAMGQSALLTAIYTATAVYFSDCFASTFAYLGTAFGLGLIAGPTVGGMFFELRGFYLPFAVIGFLLFVTAITTLVLLPSQANMENPEIQAEEVSLIRILRVPSVLVAAGVVLSASVSIGFLSAILEPHLRKFHLSPAALGSMFMINGGMYALTTPFWGRLCESWLSPCLVCGLGSAFVGSAYLLLGPSPFLPFDTILWVSIIGLAFHGIGIAAELIGSFTYAHKTVVKYGLRDTIGTFGLIAGIWTSVFALGTFVGPSVAGILFDLFGFRVASQLVLLIHTLMAVITIAWTFCQPTWEKTRYLAIRQESGSLEETLYLVY